jgi:uncharacterized protein YdhG (YjbR/CyaY superfamily)
METIQMFIQKQENPVLKSKLDEMIQWLYNNYPQLDAAIKWNQPMFMDHGTFIIAFSVSKKHISIGLEAYDMVQLHDAIEEAGYSQSKMLFRITEKDEINYDLLRRIVDFKIETKKDYTSFWR